MNCPTCSGAGCGNCGGSGDFFDNFDLIPFQYTLDVKVLASTSQPGTLTITQDADFLANFRIASRTSALLTVFMADNATGRTYMSSPVNIDNWAGTAQLPFPILEPWILPKRTSYSFVFVDSSGVDNVVELVFDGFKMFPKAKAPAKG